MTVCNESSGPFQELSDKEIRRLVESLNSLHEGELGVSMLVGCGGRAVPLLREFLLDSKPRGIFVPRQRAIRALAELKAKDVLLEYLIREQPINDPVVANSEEAVRNTTARALSAWQTDDVFYALLELLKKKRLTGVIETLGEFRRPEAIPELVMVLEDDFCRSFAEDALTKIGTPAQPALVDTARTPEPSGTHERPSSRRRRRSALRILGRLQIEGHDWTKLGALLYDQDTEIAARAGIIALEEAHPPERTLAVKRLIEALATVDWLLQSEIEGGLEQHFDIARSLINEEIRRHQIELSQRAPADNVLRLLLSIVNRHAQRGLA